MEKKATRRIIGILVVVALVIILLPLFNVNDSQNTLQTAEVKAPPFPDSQNNENATPNDTTSVAENNAAGIRSWFHKVMSRKEKDQQQAAATPDKTIIVAQSTIQPTLAEPQSNTDANAGTATPPKQQPDTLIANSAMDSEEEVEQSTMDNNVTVTNAEATPPAINSQTVANTTANTVPNTTTTTAPNTTTTTAPNTMTPAMPNTTTPQITTANPQQIQTPTTAAGVPQANTTTGPTINKPMTPNPMATPKPSMQPSSSNTSAAPKAAPESLVKTAEEMNQLAHPQPEEKPVATTVAQVKKPAQKSEKIAQVKKPVETATNTKKLAQNSQPTPKQAQIEQLKKTAWVVQMGSFKSKINAVRLTNALRAKGYKAFIYETKSNGQTRVYIGPEFKQSAAITTASRIQADMKMHGIVINYKPLEL